MNLNCFVELVAIECNRLGIGIGKKHQSMEIPEAHNRESTFVSKNLFLEHWKCLTSGTFGQTFASTEDKRSHQDFSFYFLSTQRCPA